MVMIKDQNITSKIYKLLGSAIVGEVIETTSFEFWYDDTLLCHM